MADFENYLGSRSAKANMTMQSGIPKFRSSLDTVSNSTINASMPPPSVTGSHSNTGISKGNTISVISRPRSSVGYTSKIPGSSHVRSKSSTGLKQIAVDSYSSETCFGGGSSHDMNRSLAMAQEMISTQKRREHQLTNQGE